MEKKYSKIRKKRVVWINIKHKWLLWIINSNLWSYIINRHLQEEREENIVSSKSTLISIYFMPKGQNISFKADKLNNGCIQLFKVLLIK